MSIFSWRLVRATLPPIFALLLLLTLAGHASAATFGGGDAYLLDAGETIDGNLYASGNSIVIRGTVDGDLVAAGRSIRIEPDALVTGDVMAAGFEVVVLGGVEGDVRAAGYLIQIEDSATVDGELIAAGYSLGVAEGSRLGNDFVGAGYQALVDGTVDGDLRFAGAALDLNGEVAGDVFAELDAAEGAGAPPPFFVQMFGGSAPPRTVSPGLHVADEATIGGELEYTVNAPNPDAAEPVRVEPLQPTGAAAVATPRPVTYMIEVVTTFVALFLVGLLLLWRAPGLLRSAEQVLAHDALPSAGWGVATLLVLPILGVFLVLATLALVIAFGSVTLGSLAGPILALGGLLLANLTLGFVLASWIARIVVALYIGHRLTAAISPSYGDRRVITFAVGALIVALFTELPVLGGLVGFVILMLGLGALVLLSRPHWPTGRQVAPRAEPVPA